MKKIAFIALLMLVGLNVRAQHQINSFFDNMGAVRLETQELRNDTVVSIFHRTEDVVWSRVVYSIIDLRYKQNFEMYFPANMDNPKFRSLFGVILDAVTEGMPVYGKPMNADLIPRFADSLLISRGEIVPLVELKQGDEGAAGGFDLGAMEGMEGMEDVDFAALSQTPAILIYDSINDKLQVNLEYYSQYVRNQYKFLIQEVIFFDKHYSRLYRQIMAIAPLYAPNGGDSGDPYETLFGQIVFWIPFKELRPYMAHQYMISSKNSTKRVSYDEFFAKRLYSSYIVGEDNIYDRVIPEYLKTEPDIKKEQKRIEAELLNFEQDLWEY